jgi:hypothetical protein
VDFYLRFYHDHLQKSQLQEAGQKHQEEKAEQHAMAPHSKTAETNVSMQSQVESKRTANTYCFSSHFYTHLSRSNAVSQLQLEPNSV